MNVNSASLARSRRRRDPSSKWSSRRPADRYSPRQPASASSDAPGQRFSLCIVFRLRYWMKVSDYSRAGARESSCDPDVSGTRQLFRENEGHPTELCEFLIGNFWSMSSTSGDNLCHNDRRNLPVRQRAAHLNDFCVAWCKTILDTNYLMIQDHLNDRPNDYQTHYCQTSY